MSKRIWGYHLPTGYLCSDCYAHENDDSPFDLEGEPDTTLVGVGTAGCVRCGRYATPAPRPVVGRHQCSACGCFGEDPCTAERKTEAAVVAVPKRGKRKLL